MKRRTLSSTRKVLEKNSNAQSFVQPCEMRCISKNTAGILRTLLEYKKPNRKRLGFLFLNMFSRATFGCRAGMRFEFGSILSDSRATFGCRAGMRFEFRNVLSDSRATFGCRYSRAFCSCKTSSRAAGMKRRTPFPRIKCQRKIVTRRLLFSLAKCDAFLRTLLECYANLRSCKIFVENCCLSLVCSAP